MKCCLRHVVPFATSFALMVTASSCNRTTEQQTEPGSATTSSKIPKGVHSTVVASGLCNPLDICFSPAGDLTICESGAGRVLVQKDDGTGTLRLVEWIQGFQIEDWPLVSGSGAKTMKLSCTSASWGGRRLLIVADGGLAPGEDKLRFFWNAGTAESGIESNGIPTTTGQPDDHGESHVTSMALTPDGMRLFAVGVGTNDKTWIRSADIASRSLDPYIASDDHGITADNPVRIAMWDEQDVVVLYAGRPGHDDACLVRWNTGTQNPVAQWKLKGLVDPTGMARIGKSNRLWIVTSPTSGDTGATKGRLARVTLPEGDAVVDVVIETLVRPTACAIGPDGALYVSQIGDAYDSDRGSVVKLTGLPAEN
ncbi:MAG: hypothetical protein KDC95_09275 [Planctomycetes bacterium]|nr:hypothetical protein [Planctomycetota bacterium]